LEHKTGEEEEKRNMTFGPTLVDGAKERFDKFSNA
jgi:hypothetical protein